MTDLRSQPARREAPPRLLSRSAIAVLLGLAPAQVNAILATTPPAAWATAAQYPVWSVPVIARLARAYADELKADRRRLLKRLAAIEEREDRP